MVLKARKKIEPKSYKIQNIAQLEKMLKDKSRISKIAKVPSNRQIKRMRENLPDIELEDDEVLALVDSGSTINAADIAAYFPEYVQNIVASRASSSGETATTAGGHELKNMGRCKIDATVDDHPFPVAFQNMKVDVPIISIKKYVKTGFDFHFTEEGGYMECRLNGKQFHFIECDGAYWIQIKI